MPKVSYSLGLTLKISKNSQFEFVRPQVEFSDVDAEGDVDAQLAMCAEALHKTMELGNKEVNDQIIAKMPDVDAEMQLQIGKKLQDMQRQIDALKGNLPVKKVSK